MIFLQALVVEAIAFQIADLEVLDDDIGDRREPPHDVLTLGRREIERDGLLVAIAAENDRRLTRVAAFPILEERRTHSARVVAAADALDLDDLGAQIAQRLRRERAGEHA